MFKLTNPLYYPVAVLAGGIVLIAGVRILRLPNPIILPASAAVATLGAAFLKHLEPTEEKQIQEQLKQELQAINTSAKNLAEKAKLLQQQTQFLLNKSDWDLDLLVTLQQACHHALELPSKIEELSRHLPKNNSLLSLSELQLELAEVNHKISNTSGTNKQQLQELANSLTKNINLVQSGQDIRQGQLLKLRMLIQNSAGLLQELQNRLNNSNNHYNFEEIRELTNQLNTNQTNLNTYLG